MASPFNSSDKSDINVTMMHFSAVNQHVPNSFYCVGELVIKLQAAELWGYEEVINRSVVFGSVMKKVVPTFMMNQTVYLHKISSFFLLIRQLYSGLACGS